MTQMRFGLPGSLGFSRSAEASSPRIARSERNAIHFPSGLHSASSSPPECVNGRSPACAVQSHRSWRYTLFFQSGVSVAITAEDPSGEIFASEMSVVLRYSSSVIVGLADCAKERTGKMDARATREGQKR